MRNTNLMIACMLIALTILSYFHLTDPGNNISANAVPQTIPSTGTSTTDTFTPNTTGTGKLPGSSGSTNTTSTIYFTSTHYDAVNAKQKGKNQPASIKYSSKAVKSTGASKLKNTTN